MACIEVDKEPKLWPCTKNLSVCLFHFREHIRNKDIDIIYCPINEQLSNIFTKPIPIHQFQYLWKLMIGWWQSRSARKSFRFVMYQESPTHIAVRAKFGTGKYFPEGPVCHYNRKEIKTLYFTSPKGSVTSSILVKKILCLDELGVFQEAMVTHCQLLFWMDMVAASNLTS